LKKVVIAGGSGFIGSHLTRRLIARGYDVCILSRSSAGRVAEEHLSFAEWDGRNQGPWTSALEGASAVMNLSGASIGAGRWTDSRKKEIVRSRVDSTLALVEGMRQAKKPPSVLVNSSGIGYYGDSGDAVMDETGPGGSGFLAETVKQWESAAAEAESAGVRHVALRTGLVLETKAMALKRMMLPFRLFVGGPIGSGAQWVSWVHLDDVVDGFLFAAESVSVSGPVNLCSPEPVRMKEFCAELGRVLRRPSWIPAPSFALRLLLGEMSELILTGQRAVPRELEKAGFRFRYATIRSALDDLLGREQQS